MGGLPRLSSVCFVHTRLEASRTRQPTTSAAGIKTKGIVDVGYPKVVKEIKPVLKPFEAQADDSAYEHTCDTRAKSPVFKCSAPFMKPRPSCNPGLAQVAPPAHKHHKGPWAGEVEAKSWELAVGADAPAK